MNMREKEEDFKILEMQHKKQGDQKKLDRILKQELIVFCGLGLMWMFFATFPMMLSNTFYFYSTNWWHNFLFLIGPYTVYLMCAGFYRLFHALELAANVSLNPEVPLEVKLISTEVSFFLVFWFAWSVFISAPMWFMHVLFRDDDVLFNLLIFLAPALLYLTGRILVLLFACIITSPEQVKQEYDIKVQED